MWMFRKDKLFVKFEGYLSVVVFFFWFSFEKGGKIKHFDFGTQTLSHGFYLLVIRHLISFVRDADGQNTRFHRQPSHSMYLRTNHSFFSIAMNSCWNDELYCYSILHRRLRNNYFSYAAHLYKYHWTSISTIINEKDQVNLSVVKICEIKYVAEYYDRLLYLFCGDFNFKKPLRLFNLCSFVHKCVHENHSKNS